MKWINQLAIAWATTALVSPALVPVALLGSTAPDWLEWVLEKFGHRVRHRTLTHIMLYWPSKHEAVIRGHNNLTICFIS